jgi:cephalosporin-C deacetylase
MRSATPRWLLILLAVLLAAQAVPSQEFTGQVQVRVQLDHTDWTYTPGQPVHFRITAVRDGQPLRGARVSVRIGPEMMPPTIEKTLDLPPDGATIDAGTMTTPGFLRCIASLDFDGKSYRGLATAGFQPEAIRPTTEDPPDFDTFWSGAKDALAKIPLDARLTPLPDYGTATVEVFQVNLQNIGDGTPSRLYGILCQPRAEGKYPAVLGVPGAGVRPYRGMVELAEKGLITLQIGIHGLPVNLDPSVYESLRVGALAGYPGFGLESRTRYYYYRVYLGCVRANDFLVSLPKYDGSNLLVTGGSQGGALSIVTAGLDPRVKGLAAYYPALSDVTGYLNGRAGGWPHIFRSEQDPTLRMKEKIETSRYYDVVNFARRVKAPGLYTWGFNDETCPPTSMYSAYNVIPGSKKLLLALETGHGNVPEQVDRVNRWIEEFLKAGSPQH